MLAEHVGWMESDVDHSHRSTTLGTTYLRFGNRLTLRSMTAGQPVRPLGNVFVGVVPDEIHPLLGVEVMDGRYVGMAELSRRAGFEFEFGNLPILEAAEEVLGIIEKRRASR